jgi:hypothetical protein
MGLQVASRMLLVDEDALITETASLRANLALQ